MKKSFFEKHENKLILLECLMTFLLCVLFVFKRNMIIMSADEMGPIAIAAYWSGYDWSEVMSHGAYYSYGYSIILFPLFLLFKTPELFYKSVIVINSLFSALMTLVSWSISKEMSPELKPLSRLVIALFCGSFMTNISRSSSAWDEVFIAFLCWFILFAIVKIVKTGKIRYYILCAVLSVLLYVTHQRTIGVFLVIHSFVLLISLFESKRLKGFLSYASTIAALMIAHLFIKADIKEKVWKNSIQSETNDYNLILTAHLGEKYYIFLIIVGVLSILVVSAVILTSFVLKKHKSSDGKSMKRFSRALVCCFVLLCFSAFIIVIRKKLDLSLYTISAQLLYIGMCSIGLAYIGIIFMAYRLFAWIKDGAGIEKNTNDAIFSFVLLAFLALFSVSVISTHGSANPLGAARADYMFYGRYVEPMIGIISFVGLLNLDIVWKNRYYYSYATLFMVIFTFLAVSRYELFKDLPFSFHNCVAFNLYAKGEEINFLAAEVVLSVFLILFIWVNGYLARNLLLIGGVCLALANGIVYVNDRVIPMEDSKYVYKELLEKKEKLDENVPLYYFGEEQKYIYNSSFIQYLMPGREPLLYGNMYCLPEGDFYALTENQEFLFEHSDLNMVDKAEDLYLLTNKNYENNLGITIDMDRFWFPSEDEEIEEDEKNETEEETSVVNKHEDIIIHSSNYMDGIYMYGPYIALQKGDYKVTFFYSAESIDPQGPKGSFEIVGIYGRKEYASATITDAINGRTTIPITLKEGSAQNEFRIHTVNNQNVIINKVMIKKISE